MIIGMPIVTAFNEERMCFSVDIYERNDDAEKKIGKGSVILGKIEGDEPEVKFYQVQTIYTYLSGDLAGSCYMKSDETYSNVTNVCKYASKAIWG